MKNLFQKNKTYFICVFATFAIGGVYLLQYDKPETILFFSENRNGLLDVFFSWATKMGEGPVYIAVAVAFLFFRLGQALWVGLVGFFVMGLSFLLKWLFAVDRPVAFFQKHNLLDQLTFVEGIEVHSGATSFPSGHSMSAFALYGLLILFLPNKKRYTLPLFAVAVAVAISRIYLVQHFYVDVYFGSLIGVLVAIVFYVLHEKMGFRGGHFMGKPVW